MVLCHVLIAALASSASCTGDSGRSGADAVVRPLFEDGRSAWVVVVPDGAARPVRYAATELTNTLAKISGARLGVVDAADAPRRNQIRLDCGGSGLDDVFTVKTEPGRVDLVGSSPRATLFAAYAFLRDWLDARWYWPGPSGEFLPKLTRYDVKSGSRTYRSPFRYREMSICGNIWLHRHADSERWFAKVFLNAGANTPEIRADLGFENIVSDHVVSLPYMKGKERQKLFDAHPDWFSLINGKRDIDGIAGCWSNSGFTDYIVSNLVARIRRDKIDVANFFVADVVPRCECSECTAEPDKSARWWKYYAKIREAIRGEVPEQRFAGLAYQEYRPVPSVRVDGLEYVEYCQYNRCYFHALGDSSCSRNEQSMEEFRKWGTRATMGLYGYEFDIYNKCLYLPLSHMIADEMRVFRDMRLSRVKTEYSVDLYKLAGKTPVPKSMVGQLVNRLPNYAWAMCAFDPGVDEGALLDDFCRHVYGAGAASMKAYHSLMAKSWGDLPSHVTYFGNSPMGMVGDFIPSNVAVTAKGLLKKAAAAAKADARASGEIRLDAEAFVAWSRLADEARLGVVKYDLPLLDGGDPFNTVGWLDATTPKGKAQRTKFKLYRGKDGLHVMATCHESDPEFTKGESENDKQTWMTPSVEMFIDCGDGASRQIVVSPAGGVWDAKDGDLGWNSGAKIRPSFTKDHWTLTMTLPWEGLGDLPKAGDKWKFMVIRNPRQGAGLAPTGWPKPTHRDFGAAATLVFK